MKPKICSGFFSKKICRYFAGPFVSLAEASQSWKVPNGLTWLGKEEVLLHDIRLEFVPPFLVINHYQDDDDILGVADPKPKPFIPHLDEVRLTGLTLQVKDEIYHARMSQEVRISGL